MSLVSEQELHDIDKKSRIKIARKVGRLLCSDERSNDHAAALELARLLAEDISISVREALSHQIRSAPHLPDELVQVLINDIEQVSSPFLNVSTSIDDSSMIKILNSCSELLQESIADRKEVSEALTYAICDVGALGAVSILLANDGSHLNESSAYRVTERFPKEQQLLETMAKRSDLPVEIVKSIIFKVSREYGEYLAGKFELAVDYSAYIVSLAEREVFHQALELAPDYEVYNYFCQLNAEDAITSALLFGYIQTGFVKVFSLAIAARTGQTPQALRKALELDSSKVLDKLLTKCGYSRAVIGAIVVAYERQNPKKL